MAANHLESAPQQAVERLILASAPEREQTLQELWDRYSPKFSLTEDKPGFSLEGGPFGLVLFTHRTMLQIWLLGFAAWRALHSYGGLLVLIDLTTKELDTDLLYTLSGQSEADDRFDGLVKKIRDLGQVDEVSHFRWPDEVPHPDSGKPEDVEGSAIFDLVCLATTYTFLHEVQHVKFLQDGTAPSEPTLEELECDRFARAIFLDSIETYSATSGFPAEKVRSKRAIGLALGSFFLLVLTPAELWGGSRSHPPIAQRIRQLADACDLPAHDPFWNYLSCLVLSQLRTENRMPSKIGGASTKELCFGLLDLLNPT